MADPAKGPIRPPEATPIKNKDRVVNPENVEIEKRKVRILMVNPAEFMFLFTKGLVFRKHTKIISGIPDDAVLLTVSAEPTRGLILMIVQSEEYEAIPVNEQPPFQPIEIQTGKPGATKKKKKPRK